MIYLTFGNPLMYLLLRKETHTELKRCLIHVWRVLGLSGLYLHVD